MSRRDLLRALALAAPTAMSPRLAFSAPTALSWISPARINLAHAYVLVGVAKGWFKDAGLDVEVRTGTGTAQSVAQVASSNSIFGQAGPLTSCPAIADQQADLVTIGQVQYKSFFEIASLKNKPLRNPDDWQGKTVGVMSLAGTTDVILDAMSMNAGRNPANVRKVVTGSSASGVAFLQRGEVDGFFVFPDSKIALQGMGVDLHYLATEDFAPMPGDGILVSKKNAANPEYGKPIVEFLKVCKRGLEFAQDPKNDAETIGVVAKYNPIEGGDLDKGRKVLQSMRIYATPTGGVPPIVCDTGKWEIAVRLMEKIGVIKKAGVPLGTFVDNVFAKAAVA